jgi:CheY-like chemotaxis protein
MKILVVEDSLRRMIWFHGAFMGCQLDWADSVKRAIEFLETNEYDAIFLDHDLSDEHYTYLFEGRELTPEMIEQTGRAVARWLGERPEKCSKAKIVLHSMNESGRASMASFLKGRTVEDVPFDKLKKGLRFT